MFNCYYKEYCKSGIIRGQHDHFHLWVHRAIESGRFGQFSTPSLLRAFLQLSKILNINPCVSTHTQWYMNPWIWVLFLFCEHPSERVLIISCPNVLYIWNWVIFPYQFQKKYNHQGNFLDSIKILKAVLIHMNCPKNTKFIKHPSEPLSLSLSLSVSVSVLDQKHQRQQYMIDLPKQARWLNQD